MKQIIYLSALTILLLSFTEKSAKNSSSVIAAGDTIKFHKLKKLTVVGYFDGDRIQDTIFQHNFSRLTKTEIDNSADPYQNEWETFVKWFYEQDADMFLTINNNKHDTLHLGPAQGLYCLINIGDNNADGKDEIALVIDYLDWSRMNSCLIFSLCEGKWTLLKQFGVHEDAFNFTTEEAPLFNNVKNFLEYEHGKWVYKDYLDDGYNNPKDFGKMMQLKLDRCK